MSSANIISYIKHVTGLKVYESLVPESAKLPATSFIIVSRPSEGALAGGVDLRRFNVQVDVVANSSAEVEQVIEKFQSVENSPFTGVFQWCRIIGISHFPVDDSNQKVFGASIELELTPYLA